MTTDTHSSTADQPPPGGRCDGCAFTPGTPANLSPLTLTKAQLSAMICEPFWCHRNLVDGKLPEDGKILCAGWAQMVTVLNKLGAYDVPGQEAWRQDVIRACLSALLAIEDKLIAGEDVNDLVVSAEVRRWLTEMAAESDDIDPEAAPPGCGCISCEDDRDARESEAVS